MRCGDCTAFRETGLCANCDSPRGGSEVCKSDEPCGAARFPGDAVCTRCGADADGHDIDVYEHRSGAFPRLTARLCGACSRDFERWLLMMGPEAQMRLF